ncbi:MAG: radical SAM protein [Terriglobales bacterium]
MYKSISAPLHIVWLATNQCNARCLHCSSNSAHPAPDELLTAEVFHLLDDLSDCGVLDLAVSGGEPLLRKDVFDVIAYARNRGFTVGIGSNGSTITSTVLDALLKVDINRLQVSLDGPETEHDALRRWPGLFARATKAISLAVQHGVRTHVCCTINRLNAASLEPLTRIVTELGVKRLNFSRFIPTGRGNDSLDLSPLEWREVVATVNNLRRKSKPQLDIVSHLAQEVLLDETLANIEVFRGCGAGHNQACVSFDGTVFPCVLLPISIGNIRQQPFRELWRDSHVINTLQARSTLKGQCGNCALKQSCGGCRAVAYAKTGDYLASDSRCWI